MIQAAAVLTAETALARPIVGASPLNVLKAGRGLTQRGSEIEQAAFF